MQASASSNLQQPSALSIYFRGCYNSTNFGDDLLLFGLLEALHRFLGLQRDELTAYIDPQQDSIPALRFPLPFELTPFHEPLKQWNRTLTNWDVTGLSRKLLLGLGILFFTIVYGLYWLIGLPIACFKTIRFFKQLNVLHYIGGGYFNTRLGFGFDLLVYEYLIVTFYKWVNPSGKVVGTGLGLGPVTTNHYRWLFKQFLKKFSFIHVREEESLAFVKSLNPSIDCHCLGDDATLLTPFCQEQLFPLEKKPLFAINLKYDDVHDYTALGDKLASLVATLHERGFEVAFFSFGKDHKALAHLPASLQNAFPIYNPYEMGLLPFLKELAKAQYGLGFAYHFAILGTMLKVKMANIYYDDYYRQKTDGVIKQISEVAVTLSYEQLLQTPVDTLLNQLDQVDANHLDAMVNRLGTTYRESYLTHIIKPLQESASS
jgi:polysaccharide pyruvyl transferase WcaK-like protein